MSPASSSAWTGGGQLASDPYATPAAAGPLAGIRVLDFSTLLPGPLTSHLLALAGAEVTRVERPGGDPVRHMIPGVYEGLNPGKRSIMIDLRAEGAAALVARAVGGADVVLTNLLPGARRALGLDHAALSSANPAIVSCALVGYGAGSALAEVPGHDLNFLATAGVLALTGDGEDPGGPLGVALADIAGAWSAFAAILLALHMRARTGRGEEIEVALADAALGFTGNRLAEWAARGTMPPTARPAYGVFRAADGVWLAVAALEDRFWAGLCTALGWADWESDAELARMAVRQARAAEINARLRTALAQAPAAHWLGRFGRAGLPVSRVNGPSDVTDPAGEFARSGMVRRIGGVPTLMFPARFAGWEPVAPSPAPIPGADHAAVLAGWGIPAPQAAALMAAGVVRAPDQAEAGGPAGRRTGATATERN